MRRGWEEAVVSSYVVLTCVLQNVSTSLSSSARVSYLRAVLCCVLWLLFLPFYLFFWFFSWFLLDGTILSRNGPVVVVTINYRLGVLGFFVNEDSNIKGKVK